MSVVFDKATKIARRVPDPGTDDTLAAAGALTWMTITTPIALATCIGIDAKLVHGDRWQQIEGNVTVNIFKNNTITIFQNEIYIVLGNRTTNIVGNYTKIIIGVYNHTTINAHIQLNISIRNNTYISPKNETHVAPKNTDEPTGFFRKIAQCFQFDIFQFSFTAIKIDTAINMTEAVLSKFEMIAIHTEAKGVENTAEGGNMTLIALENKLDAIGTRIQGLQPSVGALKGHLVGLTLKTLVLGVNQFI